MSKSPAVTIALARAQRTGYGLGRAAMAADVKARVELLEQAKTLELSTGRAIMVEDLFDLIDEEAHRVPRS